MDYYMDEMQKHTGPHVPIKEFVEMVNLHNATAHQALEIVSNLYLIMIYYFFKIISIV